VLAGADGASASSPQRASISLAAAQVAILAAAATARDESTRAAADVASAVDHVAASSLEAFRQWRRRGHAIGYATGRNEHHGINGRSCCSTW
jgi:hypothetical protein